MGILDNFFGEQVQAIGTNNSALEAIEQELSYFEPRQAKYLASLAVLLGHVAYADLHISAEEKDFIQTCLHSRLKLSQKEAEAITHLATEKGICLSFDIHTVWQNLNEMLDRSGKGAVMDMLFELAALDNINTEENQSLLLVAKAFGFTHQEYCEQRIKYREAMSYNQKP